MGQYCKAFVIFTVFMLCILVSGTVVALDENLLPNPSIEIEDPSSPGKPDSWKTWKSAGDQYVVDFEWSNKVARSGKHSLKIGAVSKGGKATWQSTYVDVTPAMTYRASVYVKVEGARVGESITLTIVWRDSGNKRLGTVSETFVITESDMDWTLVTLEEAAFENCARAGVEVGRGENTQGSVWFDDFKLVNIQEPKYKGILSYPNSFSDGEEIRLGLVLGEAQAFKLSVYDERANLIWRSQEVYGEEGYNEIAWDGRDSKGDIVQPGIYLCIATPTNEHTYVLERGIVLKTL